MMLPAIRLLPKLALFFLAFGLPALFVLDLTRANLEYRDLQARLNGAAILAEVRREADALARHQAQRELAGLGMARDLERWVLRLGQRSHPVFGDAAIGLAEHGEEPLQAFLLDHAGRVLAGSRNPRLPTPQNDLLDLALPETRYDDKVRVLGTPQHRMFLARVQGDADQYLALTVSLLAPSDNLLSRASLEWPIMLLDGVLFALAAALFLRAWVTRRLQRVAHAAQDWRRGELATRIDDDSGDEISAIAAELDRIPPALSELIQARAALASADERARLARDLHDTVKQKAFALAMQLAAAETRLRPEQRRELSESRQLIDEIQRALVALLDDLKPMPALAFEASLQAEVEAWSRRAGIAVLLNLSAAADVPFPDQSEVLAFVTEALSNVQRHSLARRVEVSLVREHERLLLTVEDDGQGGALPGTGRGLAHLRARAESMREGRFDLRSNTDGTRVQLIWRV